MFEDPQLNTWVDRIDTELVRSFADKDMRCNPLDRAMEYTVLAGGKRLRPLLTMVTCETFGGDGDAALPMALAAELLHTYSLVHDDLPCMDNDEIRRGKPTNHIVFGEAQAVLAGDALQTEAFEILATGPYSGLAPERRLCIIAELAQAAGRRGMVAGQTMDLESEGMPIDHARLELLHRRKTGALLRFCIRLGGHLAGAEEATMGNLTRFAEAIGLLFQVVDDLLDEEGSSSGLGKTVGKDVASGKATFPRLMGSDAAHQFADQLQAEALDALADEGKREGHLVTLSRYIRSRGH